jgi:hypothetical protein
MRVLPEQESIVPAERHYAVIEVADMWHLSPDKVREIFEHEPGVLVIAERNPRHKRGYLTLRIPYTVLVRSTTGSPRLLERHRKTREHCAELANSFA